MIACDLHCGAEFPEVGQLAAHRIEDHRVRPGEALIRARAAAGLETNRPAWIEAPRPIMRKNDKIRASWTPERRRALSQKIREMHRRRRETRMLQAGGAMR